jgi:hypothetical protein
MAAREVARDDGKLVEEHSPRSVNHEPGKSEHEWHEVNKRGHGEIPISKNHFEASSSADCL